MLQSRDVIEQKQGNHIIRIRSDSETNLDDLFTAVMQPKVSQTQGHLSVPMRMRNLPASFFQQPNHCINSPSHSRESSLDNTLSQPTTNASSLQNNSINNNTSPPPLQSSHLRAHSSPATFQQMYDIAAQQHEHLRQQSFDVTDNIPLPPGWQMAKTASGQKYFLNHHTQTTTWKDPRQKLSTGSLLNSSEIACSSQSISPASSLPSLGPLPDGWEQATTDEGEVYFINHNTRTTSWFPPKISMQLQQPLAAPISSTQDQNINSRLQTNASTSAATPSSIINSQTMQQQQQQLRLQQLQMEREALRLRQQEIMAQELMLGRNKTFQRTGSSNTTEKSSTNCSSVDPFLNTDKDFHSRQESSDSGLDMGTSYSHPNTPDDYLMSTDDVVLDIAELNLGSISVSSLDMVPENMDSDDLEPSFQDVLNENILQLNDVQELINKENTLKWL